MFDGNYRSRRNVDLGSNGTGRARGRNRNSGSTKSKATLLEETRKLREERRIQQQRERSTKLIQRCYRGWKVRCYIIRQLQQKWETLQPNEKQNNSAAFYVHILTEQTLLLSMRLSLRHSRDDYEKTDIALLEHAKTIQQQQQQQQQENASPSAMASFSFCSSSRIVLATLNKLMNPQEVLTTTVEIPHSDDGSSPSLSVVPGERLRLYLAILQYYLSSPVRGLAPAQTQEQSKLQQQQQQQQPSSLELVQRLGGIHNCNGSCFQLFQCTQQWLYYCDDSNTSCLSAVDAHTIGMIDTFRDKLWQWTCSVLPHLQNHNKAIMGAILFGKQGLLDNHKLIKYVDYDQINQCFLALVQFITTTTLSTSSATANGNSNQNVACNSNTDHDNATSHTIRQTLNNRESIVLSNALSLLKKTTAIKKQGAQSSPYQSVLRLIYHVLITKPDLAFLTSLVVRGEDITSIRNNQITVTMQSSAQDEDDLSDGEDDEDENYDNKNNLDEKQQQQQQQHPVEASVASAAPISETVTQQQNQKKHKSSPPSSSVAASLHRRRYRPLTKQDFQTIPKLDRLYQDQIQQWRKQTLATLQHKDIEYQKSMIDLALQIGDANIWLQWQKLHGNINNNDEKMISDDLNSNDNADFFGPFVALLLQGVTGVKPSASASSPFLTQLAFEGGKSLIKKLWSTILDHLGNRKNGTSSFNETTCIYMTVFCDIFAQYLIAITDEKFLDQYTTSNASNKSMSTGLVIEAEHIIIRLKHLLHELYWSKPVTAHDIHLAANMDSISEIQLDEELRIRALRGRLLLSGTKCWNSLYERWCRLVRHAPFCDESTWLFPHLVTREGNSAVVDVYDNTVGNNDSNLTDTFDSHIPLQQRRLPEQQHRRHRHRPDSSAMDEDDSVASMDIDDDDDDDDENNGATGGTNNDNAAAGTAQSNLDAESEALADSFRDPKMARILTCIPQALPFDRRVRLFHSLLTADKMKTQDETSEFRMAMLMIMRGGEDPENFDSTGGRERVEIRRDNLYEDSMRQLNQLGPKLKRKVQVAFINQHGTQEAGIDGGGVFKEFVDDLIRDAFSIDSNANADSDSNSNSDRNRSLSIPTLFAVTPLQTLSVNTALAVNNELLSHYEFMGRVLGKAVYESILVEPQFCLPFLNQLLGKRNSLEDLKNFDMEYYKNLTKLLSLRGEEIDDMGLTFELTTLSGNTNSNSASMKRTSNDTSVVELVPGGRNRNVTKQNVIQYVHLVANQKLNIEPAVQTRAFLRGFRDLIPASWVRLFSANELQKLIGGDDSIRGIDVASLQRTIQYAAGYHPSQPIIQWLWEVIEEFTPEQQRKFLKFMTSCSRQPLLGFQSLEPAPCIQQIRLPDQLFLGNNDNNFDNDDIVNTTMYKNTPLPTSSTCMNLLKLPNYRSKELLRKKLLDAIESGSGFELT